MTAHRHHTFVLPLLVAITVILTGCTTPLPGLPAPVPGGPATIYPPGAKVPDLSGRPEQFTPEQRIAVSQAATDAWTPQRTGDPAADARSLLDTIAKTPGFADAGLGGDGSVWARFVDGLPITWIIAGKSEQTDEPSLQPSVAVPPAPKIAPVPNRPDAATFEFPSMFSSGVPAAVSSMLTDAGYQTRALNNDVADLETKVKNLGVLLAMTHGGVSRTMIGEDTYTLATHELWRARPEDAPKFAMYRDGLLVPAVFSPLIGSATYYWGVDTAFVKAKWSFAADALVFIGACGMFASPEGLAFVDALRSVSQGGSATILGWDGSVLIPYNGLTIKRFFARVLGDNTIDQEDVPRRPFTYKQVFDWMTESGQIQLDPWSPKLVISYGPAGDGQLRPSITRVNLLRPGKGGTVPHAGDEYLEISGSFGPDPGPDLRKVTLGGQPLTVYDGDGWSPQQILAKIPAGQSLTEIGGDLVVTVRNHPSNILPITHWTGSVSMDQTIAGTGGKGHLTFDCRLRASGDVHFFRHTPTSTPKVSFVVPLDFPDGCHWRLSGKTESCTFGGSGRVDNPVLSGAVTTGGKRPVNTDNDSHYPVQAYVVAPASRDAMIGTITCGDGTHRYHTVPIYFGSYENAAPLTLPSSMFVTGTQLSCDWGPVKPCTEKWTLTPGVGVPTKQTQA